MVTNAKRVLNEVIRIQSREKDALLMPLISAVDINVGELYGTEQKTTGFKPYSELTDDGIPRRSFPKLEEDRLIFKGCRTKFDKRTGLYYHIKKFSNADFYINISVSPDPESTRQCKHLGVSPSGEIDYVEYLLNGNTRVSKREPSKISIRDDEFEITYRITENEEYNFLISLKDLSKPINEKNIDYVEVAHRICIDDCNKPCISFATIDPNEKIHMLTAKDRIKKGDQEVADFMKTCNGVSLERVR